MAQINNSTVNPWYNIVKGDNDEIIAECDLAYITNKYGSLSQYVKLINKKYEEAVLTFDCLPEPYSGNPESKVYCLNKNPGKPDSCFNDDPSFNDATILNLQLKSKSCFWAENLKNRCGKQHDGVDWLKTRTNKLEEILNGHPDIFFIEYFPYHSSKGFKFPKDLPSYKFTDTLIEQAMKEGKLIIIMREKKGWLDRIDGLKDYPNLYCLNCAQGGYLTPNNIVRIDKNGDKHHLSENEIKKYFKL